MGPARPGTHFWGGTRGYRSARARRRLSRPDEWPAWPKPAVPAHHVRRYPHQPVRRSVTAGCRRCRLDRSHRRRGPYGRSGNRANLPVGSRSYGHLSFDRAGRVAICWAGAPQTGVHPAALTLCTTLVPTPHSRATSAKTPSIWRRLMGIRPPSADNALHNEMKSPALVFDAINLFELLLKQQ